MSFIEDYPYSLNKKEVRKFDIKKIVWKKDLNIKKQSINKYKTQLKILFKMILKSFQKTILLIYKSIPNIFFLLVPNCFF